MTAFTGSMALVYLHLALYAAWIFRERGGIPGLPRFYPSFVILATEELVEAIFLSTCRPCTHQPKSHGCRVRQAADLDLHKSLPTEHELTKLMAVVTDIVARLNVPSEQHREAHRVGIAERTPVSVTECPTAVPGGFNTTRTGRRDASQRRGGPYPRVGAAWTRRLTP